MNNIEVIAFDADDTLWENESYFRDAEHTYAGLMSAYGNQTHILAELLKTEYLNMPVYGYGIKGFMLSMIETGMRLTNGQLPPDTVQHILSLGRAMIHKPVEVYAGVEETLAGLFGKYRLVMATKGDLLDQERKLNKSGLAHYFHHIEIMSEKKEMHYRKLMKHLDVRPDQFMMVGNSVKSDIVPVVALGAYAVHIPAATTWVMEEAELPTDTNRLMQLSHMTQLVPVLTGLVPVS